MQDLSQLRSQLYSFIQVQNSLKLVLEGPLLDLICLSAVFRRIHKIAKSDYERRHFCISVCLPVRMEQLVSK
jgi:hypothetical protein